MAQLLTASSGNKGGGKRSTAVAESSGEQHRRSNTLLVHFSCFAIPRKEPNKSTNPVQNLASSPPFSVFVASGGHPLMKPKGRDLEK